MVWGLFVVIIVFMIAVSVILSYHWREYSTDAQKKRKVMVLLIAMNAIFTTVMFLAAIFYTDGY